MKRCPQCEFIYEDDQSLCDMDGVLLVLDSRTLPNLHALATVPAKVPQRRNRAVPAFATLVLALVLGMVYYVSSQRNPAPNTYSPAGATSISNAAPVSNPTPEPQPSESPKEEAKPAPAKRPVVKATALTPRTRTSPKPKKDESKVGSLLKKTGRILKKPFKF